jgi:peroxiredoxin
MRFGLLAASLLLSGCVPHLYTPVDSDDTDDVGTCDWTAPTNTWPVATPPECLKGEGFSPGQTVPDFRLMDQNGDTASLWQFYGDVIVWDLSTIWCSPCQKLASHAEELYQEHKDEGFIYLTILAQDLDGNPPDQSDLALWAGNFDLTTPVVADPDNGYTLRAIPDSQYPVVLVIDRQMKVCQKVPPPYDTDDNLLAAIDLCSD